MENLDIVKEVVNDLLRTMGFRGVVTASYDEAEDCVLANIQVDQTESGCLIGQSGNNLDSLQHLARLLINKKKQDNDFLKFILDVNNYRKNRIEMLKETAKEIAKQVLMEKTSLALRPMPAYERRIIHLALADYSLIDTESIGDEPERRIVVRIKSDI